MDLVKNAFSKVKDDIGFINQDISSLKQDISSLNQNIQFYEKSMIEIREKIAQICNILNQLTQTVMSFKEQQQNLEDYLREMNSLQNISSSKLPQNFSSCDLPQNSSNLPFVSPKDVSTEQIDTSTDRQTDRHIVSTTSTHPSTHKTGFKALKPQILPFSTGNEGVSTDRQTDTSTDRQTDNSVFKSPSNTSNPIDNASEILDSLDNIKKEIRLKFKRLTDQEVLVFSTLYQLEEENGYADYKSLSKKLNLSESSIRDYIGRLTKKQIPLDKVKINNKNIHLSISKNLKKIATLPTILHLREI